MKKNECEEMTAEKVFEAMADKDIDAVQVADKPLTCDGKMLEQLMDGKDTRERAETILNYMAHDSDVLTAVFHRLVWEHFVFMKMADLTQSEPLKEEVFDEMFGNTMSGMAREIVSKTWPEHYMSTLAALTRMMAGKQDEHKKKSEGDKSKA